MITEDYVYFEVAKLLKEKGFDEPCLMCYTYDEKLGNYGQYNSYKNSEVFSLTAPTIQMAMKWLREKRKINIEIFTYWSIQEKAVYGNRIVSVEHAANVFKEIDIAYDTYEEACEAAIKYCLENLI